MNRPHVRYLVLWLTTACNLNCRYCYRKNDAHAAMSKDVVLAALSLATRSGLPFHIQLAGGEPTLEPDMIEFVGRRVLEDRLPATLALQTNGTLWDRKMVDLCRRYKIAIGVSLDGPPDVQESLRGRSGATFRSLAMFEQERMPVRVTTVLSSINITRLYDLVLTLSGFNNIRGVGFDPLVMTGAAQERTDLLPSAANVRAGIRDFMEGLEQIKACRNVSFEWREMQVILRALTEKRSFRPYCHACRGESLAVHPNGEVYPCGQSVGDPVMSVGTVDAIDWNKLVSCYQGITLRGDCPSCPLKNRCPGDCPSRLRYNQSSLVPTMCTLYRTVAEKLIEKTSERSVS